MLSINKYQQFLIASLAPILWGTTYVVVNLGLQGATPIWIAVFRALPAGLLLLVIKPQGLPIAISKMLLLSFLNISCFFVLLFIGAYRLPGSVAGTLGSLFPIILMGLGWAFYGEKPKKSSLMLSGLGILGVCFLLNPLTSSESLTNSHIDILGVLASISAIVAISISTLWMRNWHIKSMYGLTAWQLTLGGAMLIPVAMIYESLTPTVHTDMTVALLWLIVLNTAIGYLAFIYSTKNMATAEIGLLALLNPIVAVSTGVLLANEQLSMSQYIGISMILLALFALVNPMSLMKKFG